MKRFLRPTYALVALLGALCLTSCLAPKGDTVAEQRAFADHRRDESLAALCEDHSDLKEQLAKSAGYVVFNNFSLHVGLISFATGHGVLTDNATKKETYLKWKRLTIGPGIAAKGMYGVVLFDDAKTVEKFAKGPWVTGGQGELGFVFGDFGGALELAWLYNGHAKAYYTTHTGVALELELFGIGKVSNNRDLNREAKP
jgi:lipid-binding SYLF domain-containing protein